MNLLTVLLLVYSLGLIGVGWWAGRAVRRTEDYFVAGRSLGPGLIFATFLAANIGASSTVGATGHAYRDGLAAWWWNGSAGLGSLVLAFWIGPRMWQQAKEHNLLTVGDFLEHHFGRGVRGFAAVAIWLGSLFILCGQLKGASLVLERACGLPLGTGAFLASIVTVAYFMMGGMKSAVWVNGIQLVVILAGFALAAPFASHGGRRRDSCQVWSRTSGQAPASAGRACCFSAPRSFCPLVSCRRHTAHGTRGRSREAWRGTASR